MKQFLLTIILAPVAFSTLNAQHKTENVVIVTLDGMRWQEVFGGADSALMNNKNYTKDNAGIAKKVWADDIKERRKKLFPFLWTTI